MSKIATDIEQSKKLLELGVNSDTADMYYPNRVGDTNEHVLPLVFKHGNPLLSQEIPAWSLGALMELLPEVLMLPECNYYPEVVTNCCGYTNFNSSRIYRSEDASTTVDAVFNMIVWLKKNKLL